MKILWLADVYGWAFHTRAELVSKMLPEYEHDIVIGKKNIEEVDSSKYDIVCVPVTSILTRIDFKCKVILEMQSMRELM